MTTAARGENGEGLPPLSVSAKSAVLIEADSGLPLFEKDSDIMLGMASTTKIMTALVAAESGKLDDIVTIQENMVGVEGSSLYLKAGERLSLEELLYGLMLRSGNDAAVAIACHVGGDVDGFVDMMNERAMKMGLLNTRFMNPHGLYHDNHYTTARELAMIAAEAMKNETIAKITSSREKRIPYYEEGQYRVLTNHNKLLKIYEGADGVKTGYTKKTGRCLVSSAVRGGMRLIAVTMNAPDDWNDHVAMLDYGFANYEKKLLVSPGDRQYSLPVTGGEKPHVNIETAGELFALTQKGGENDIVFEAHLPRFLYAPVAKGDKVGELLVSVNGVEAGRAPLICDGRVEERPRPPTLWDRIAGFFRGLWLIFWPS